MCTQQTVDFLLVEDNPSDAELAMEALRGAGLADHVVWVKDGAEALAFVRAEGVHAQRPTSARPRVILLDLRLPKVDGLEVLEALKADRSTRSIPIVVLTSSNEDHDVARAYELGVNSFVTKPVAFESFAQVLSMVGAYWLTVNRTPR
jgi:CheY-like chemotaxis protein